MGEFGACPSIDAPSNIFAKTATYAPATARALYQAAPLEIVGKHGQYPNEIRFKT